MNALSFGFEDKSVRVMEREGAPWFVAQDVCGCLGIGNHRQATSTLDDDERDDVTINDAIGREQSQLVVSESGVYALIFRSRKPEAKRFRKWVTQEVLPTLRQTGAYMMAANDTAEDADDPLPLDAPDDIDRMRVKLGLVREARYVYGRKTARGLWEQLGLPDCRTEKLPQLGYSPDDVSADLKRWMGARCELIAGAREETMALYADYGEWCDERDIEAMSMVQFSRQLTRFGLGNIKSNRYHRIGIRLKD